MEPARHSRAPIPFSETASELALADWEVAVIELFVHASQMIGLPKSMGQIYGLLYCSDEARPMDDIMATLSISKGSASQGLKTLRQLNAVKLVFKVGDRRDHFEAELGLRRLVSGFLAEQVKPHIASGHQRLQHLEELVAGAPPEQRELATDRVQTLRVWHSKTDKILPLIQKLL